MQGDHAFLQLAQLTELKHMDSDLALQQFPTVFITKTAQLHSRKKIKTDHCYRGREGKEGRCGVVTCRREANAELSRGQ